MKRYFVLHFLGILFTLMSIITRTTQTSPTISPYHRVCLMDQTSQYRQGGGRLALDDVTDPSMCTHLVYGHVLVDGDTAGLVPPGDYEEDNYLTLSSLKTSNPGLIIMLSIGGREGSQAIETIANSTDDIDLFAQSCVDFVRERYFDGILVDWTPTTGQEDMETHLDNFSNLIERMSSIFKHDATHTGRAGLLLTAAISGDRDSIETFYPVQALAQYADLILVKSYDFYTAEIPLIGHQSALYPREDEEGYFTVLNLDFSVRYLQYLEVPSHKLVIGVPSHGRSLRFVNASLQYFGADHMGPGAPGPYSQENGKLAYFEICDLLATGWVESFHEEHQVPFAFSDEEIVTYDNQQSITQKVNYVKDNQLGGLFISNLADDDFQGTFCHNQPFPLTQAIKNAFLQSRDACYHGEHGSVDYPGCTPCPLGSYQPSPHQTQCISCPSGYATLETGASKPEQCLVDCGSGYEYNYISKSCDICPVGYFREALTHTHCYRCPVGMTTVAKGSSHCVEKPDDVELLAGERVTVSTVALFEVDSCENEPVLMSAITHSIHDLVQETASVWESLCDLDCSNLQLRKDQGCVSEGRRSKVSLGVNVRLVNISLDTDNGEFTRLASKVLEQAFYQPDSYQDLENYGVYFSGLRDISSTVVCENGSEVVGSVCTPCPVGSFHNLTTSACQKCPLGSYQDAPEMTSCRKCDPFTSTVVSGAVSPKHCLSPCDAKPHFCHNGGMCHWTEENVTSLYCQCFDGYTGDRCDVISDAYVDTGVIIGSSIGAVLVLLLIVLIVVAFVACVRYTKVKKSTKSGTKTSSNQGQGQRPSSSLHRSTISSKAYIVNSSSRGHRLMDSQDYYNWLYLSQHYFLPPNQQQGTLSQHGLKVVPSTLPNIHINHSASACSPDLSGTSKRSTYTATEF